MKTRILVVLALTVGLGARAVAQVPGGQPTPELAARTVLEAMWHGDYLTAARATGPRNLRQTREIFDSLGWNGRAGPIAELFFQPPDSQAVVAMDDVTFTAGLLRYLWLLRGSDRDAAIVKGVDIQGSVLRGSDTAHVVYRWIFPPDSLRVQSYEVQTVVRCGNAWCADMSPEVRTVVYLLKYESLTVKQ